jgi:poly(A) polymerase
MRVTGDWLTHPGTVAVCAAIEGAGFQSLFVGGCVRDALLDRPVGDIDIATDARPEQVIGLAKSAGLRAIPTGIDHGTITVVADGLAHEITTFRADLETDGRHATVGFSDDVATDAARRDFTMNALYATPRGDVVDPLGGLPDLKARRLRFVGDPAQRIGEDYLRILRFFRFFAWYGDVDQGMDADALAAIAEHGQGLDGLSRERVGSEMRKLLAAPDPSFAVAAMRQTGVLAHVLPGADDKALGILVHLEGSMPADPIRRLAVLGGTEPVSALRLSKSEARDLTILRDAMGAMMSPGETGYRLKSRAVDALVLRAALFEQPLDAGDVAAAKSGADQHFPLRADDLMPRYTGAELGAKLKQAEAQWIASGFTMDVADLLAWLDR